MDIQEILGLLNGTGLDGLSDLLNVNSTEAKKGLSSALPSILGALNKNTSTSEGAEALNKALAKDHDGSIFDNLAGYLNNPNLSEGAGILGHLFGNSTSDVANSVAKLSGMSAENSTKLLQTLAPLVMGTLGQIKKSTNMDATGLNGLISMLTSALNLSDNGNTTSENAGGLMSMLTGMLDTNKDGKIGDDLLNLAGSLFSNKK